MLTPQTLSFLRNLCDQVRIEPPLSGTEARASVASLWQAVDELEAEIRACGQGQVSVDGAHTSELVG